MSHHVNDRVIKDRYEYGNSGKSEWVLFKRNVF